MSKFTSANEKIAEKVVAGYKIIESCVVEGYKIIESGVVEGYKIMERGVVAGFQKVSDKMIEKLFTKDGETVVEAKKRLSENK